MGTEQIKIPFGIDDPQSTSSLPAVHALAKTSRKHLYRIENMVARDGIEPPTPAFSGLRSTI